MERDDPILRLSDAGKDDLNRGSSQQFSPVGEEQETTPTQHVSVSTEPKSTEGENWWMDEGNLLVQAWKKTSGKRLGTTSDDDEVEVHTRDDVTERRPRGRKYEKERLRKGKRSVSDGSACKLSLETVWAQKLEKDEIREAKKQALYERAFALQEKQMTIKERAFALQEEQMAIEKFELEERIMSMDTSAMTGARLQFYRAEQAQIAAHRHNTSG